MRRVDNSLARLWYDLFDRDIERLLSGAEPQNSDLAPLIPFVKSVETFGKVQVSEHFISDHAAIAATTLKNLHQTDHATGSRWQEVVGQKLKNRFATAAAGLVILSGLTGIAWAADGAAPGDWNYEIDRTLENVGIGAGGVDERLEELSAVNQSGRAHEALQRVSNMLPSEPAPQAKLSLNDAAERVANIEPGGENAKMVRRQVADLLGYISKNRSNIDGQYVAEMSKGIGRRGNSPGDPVSNNEKVSGKSSDKGAKEKSVKDKGRKGK